MAQAYTRQSTIADGDTITAALFNDEYNQLLNAFVYHASSATNSGHRHDGTTGGGGSIFRIGDLDFLNKIEADSTNNRWGVFVEVSSAAVEQVRISDGVFSPVTDSDIDIGTSSLYFKNAYIDSITTTGNVAVGGNLTVTGTTTFNGGTLTLGDSAADNVVFGADVNSDIIPNTDSAFDLGSSSQEWRDLYLDGTAHIDTLDVDVNATVAGTLGVTGVLTGTSLDISGDIDVDGTTNLDVVDIDGAVDMATTLAVAGNVDFNGDLDVDGTTNLDVVDIDGAVDMATTLAVAGNVDFNGDLDVDGTTNLDVVDIDGAVDMATTLAVGGEITAASLDISGNADIDGTLETDALSINSTAVTSTAAELNILDGVTSTAAELNILDGVTSTATELNILDGVTSTTAELNILDGVTASTADINLIDGITNGTVIASKAIITDTNIDITGGRNITISGELDAATLDISGDADIDGTLEADAITIGGVTLAETISDTVGAMVSSNTESGITVAYQDADNTLDFTVGTLNQNTTGSAATLTTARTIGGTSFDGSANIAVALAAEATTLATARTIGGVSFDGSANINLPGVNAAGNQNTSGTAAIATTVTITDNESTNENNAIIFTAGGDLDGGNLGLESDGDLKYNPSTGTLSATNISVSGTLSTVDSVTMSANNAVVFEGATADAHETTLTSVDATADRTITLPNVSGTVPVLAAASNTQITSTPEELNILDGVTATATELNLIDGVTATTAELNILDGVTSTAAELNILDGVTSTAAELNILDGVTSTAAELNALDGITAVVGELNALDIGSTAVGTAVASKAVILDSSKDYTGIRNLTISGELDAATLDISGAIDVAGTTNLDVVDIDGAVQIDATVSVGVDDQGYDVKFFGDTASAYMLWDTSSDDLILGGGAGLIVPDGQFTLASTAVTSTAAELNILDGKAFLDEDNLASDSATGIASQQSIKAYVDAAGTTTEGVQDIVGAMFSSNTETGITATYQDADGTVDLVVGTLNQNTTGSAATLTTARAIAVAGDVTGTANFDGSAGISITTTLAADAIVTANITNANVTLAKMAANSVDSDQYVDGSIDTAHYADNSITGAELADNIDIAGTFDVTGATTLDSTLNVAGVVTANAGVVVDNITIDGTQIDLSSGDLTLDVAGDIILDAGGGDLIISDDATIVGTISTGTSDLKIRSRVSDKDMIFQGNDGGSEISALTLDMSASGAATFNSQVTIGGNLVHAGNLTIDAAGDITLDGDGADIKFSDGGTEFGRFSSTSSNLNIFSPVSDKDIVFKGNDGGATITALTLDMSAAGAATFNDKITAVGTSVFTNLDISGDVDVDGTLEADAITLGGVTLAETIADTVGAMVSSNTESGITVAYQDGDNTLDFTVGTLNQNTTGTAATVTTAAQPNITSLGTLTTLTVDNVIINGSTIGHTGDTDLITVASGIATVAGEVSMTTLDIGGTNVTSTAAELNILDGVTSTAAELNILDGVTSTAAELNALDGITAVVGELNALDIGGTAVGTAVASKAVILDSNKDYTGLRNLTITGELDAATLDISGNVDIDGVLETDNLTVGGAQGTDGQVLTSTGSGVGWEDAGGGVTFKAFGTSSLMVGDDATGTIDAANYNTALGVDVFAALTSGDNNVAVGYSAGAAVTTGGNNTFVGALAGDAITTASDHTAIGYNASGSATIGSGNTSVGSGANASFITSSYNTAVGYHALNRNTHTGNTAVGWTAGYDLLYGVNNTAIGKDAQPPGSYVSNTFTLGDGGVTNLRCNDTSISSLSDRRDKAEITDLESTAGLELIMKLRPVTYYWDRREWYDDNIADGSKIERTYDNEIANSGQKLGFVAQEALEAASGIKSLEDSQFVATLNPDKLELAPAHLITPLVKAIQEQNALIEALTARVTTLEG